MHIYLCVAGRAVYSVETGGGRLADGVYLRMATSNQRVIIIGEGEGQETPLVI